MVKCPVTMIMMKARYMLPLLALSVASAYAGERETFDFGWKFKYFGPGDPADAGIPVSTDSYQGEHPASHAVDGDLMTRWCAKNQGQGHHLMIRPGFSTPIKMAVVYWESRNNMKLTAEIDYGTSKEVRQFRVGHQAATFIDLKGKKVESIKLTVNDATWEKWASIREVMFTGVNSEPLQVKKGAPAEVQAMPGVDESGYKSVQLPHDWAIESPFLMDEPNETGKLPWNGWGWYRKHFAVPADFSAEKDRYYLDFDGVMANPQVYVNGKLAGNWAYGYNSFRVDITPYLEAGKDNLVAVMASNLPLSTRWYPGAGIYRHVWLEKTGPVHLTQWPTYITTPEITEDYAMVKVQTTVANTGKKEAEITVLQSVAGVQAVPASITLEPGTTGTVEQELRLPKPLLWSCENPNLYSMKTQVLAGNQVVDSKESSFGVRTIEWKKEGFFLNGKRVKLKGVCEHHDLGALGSAFHARGYERKIEILKEMGCNSIRMTHNPPAPEVLDLCDKHGVLVIDELFDIWKQQKYDKSNGYHLYWPKWWQKDVQNFMLRDRNHPSIIAWSGGNEIPEQGHDDAKRHAKNLKVASDLRDEFRKYDTTRPYTVGCNDARAWKNGFSETMDVFGFNYKPHLYAEFRKRHPEQPYIASETCSCVSTRDTYFFPMKWDVHSGARYFQVSSYALSSTGWGSCPDIEMHAHTKAPDLAGEYVWTGFDYIGEPTPYNQDASNIGNFIGASEAEKKAAMEQLAAMGNKAPSRSSYFGLIDLAGFPKDIYYLYQSQWNAEKPMAHILPHWNWQGREGQKTPVMVFTSGDEAELFVNGKSQGVRRRGEGPTFNQKDKSLVVSKNQFRFAWEDVVYEPGTVEVVVKKNGQPWATAKRVTTGAAASVAAEVDRASILGDARDLCHISLSLTDAQGNVVPTDSRKVSFSIEVPAVLAGFCNGNPIDHTSLQDPNQSFFNGRILAVVRAQRNSSGTATVTVKADGLPEIKVPVQITAPTPEQLKK